MFQNAFHSCFSFTANSAFVLLWCNRNMAHVFQIRFTLLSIRPVRFLPLIFAVVNIVTAVIISTSAVNYCRLQPRTLSALVIIRAVRLSFVYFCTSDTTQQLVRRQRNISKNKGGRVQRQGPSISQCQNNKQYYEIVTLRGRQLTISTSRTTEFWRLELKSCKWCLQSDF